LSDSRRDFLSETNVANANTGRELPMTRIGTAVVGPDFTQNVDGGFGLNKGRAVIRRGPLFWRVSPHVDEAGLTPRVSFATLVPSI